MRLRRWSLAPLAFVLALAGGCNNTTGGSAGPSGGASGAVTPTVTGDMIPVGQYASMTGDDADFGIQANSGVALAVDKINAAGGVKGKKIDLHTENDESSPEKAANVVTKLISSDKVVAVLGEVASSRSLAAAPKCQQALVPMISPASTNVKVTEVGDYIFRVCFVDSFQAYVMAKFARETLKANTAAIFVDSGSAYSTAFGDEFKKWFTKLGGQIVAEAAYTTTDSDFKGQLSKMKTANPQTILVPGYYKSVGEIGKQARELGIAVPLLGGDGWNSHDIFVTAGNSLEGCYYSAHVALDNPDPTIQAFVADYKKKWGADKIPDGNAALGYDAMMILADSMNRASTLSGTAIRDAIAQTKDYKGVTGTITINKDRNADKPAVVLQIKGHDFKYVETIEPPKE